MPPKTKVRAEAPLLYDELIKRYFSQISAENTESTIYDKSLAFEKYISPKFQGKNIRKVDKSFLYEWQDYLWEITNPRNGKPYSYNYCTKIWMYLSSFFQWVEQRYSISNPLSSIKRPRRIDMPVEISIWEEEEFLRFISVVDDITLQMFFTILFYTGVRVGEANALTNEKIGNGQIVINASITRKTLDGSPWKIKGTKNKKNRTNRIISIVNYQVKEYKLWKTKAGISGNLFFLGDRPISETSYQRALKKYCALSSVKKIRIHDFRHSYVSMLIHYGASPTLVADLIGDSLAQVIKTYGHLWTSERDSVVKMLDEKHIKTN